MDHDSVMYAYNDIIRSTLGDVIKALVQAGVDITPAYDNIADVISYSGDKEKNRQIIRCALNLIK